MPDTFCLRCGAGIEEWDAAYYARQMLCIPCWQRKQAEAAKKPCQKCYVRAREGELRFFRDKYLCPYCYREAQAEVKAKECAFCKKWIEDWEKKFQLPDGHFICEGCHRKGLGKLGLKCSKCGRPPKYPYMAPDGKIYCENCAVEAKAEAQPLLARAVSKIAKMLAD